MCKKKYKGQNRNSRRGRRGRWARGWLLGGWRFNIAADPKTHKHTYVFLLNLFFVMFLLCFVVVVFFSGKIYNYYKQLSHMSATHRSIQVISG